MRIFLKLAFLALVGVPVFAQIPAPQINLTGNIGCQGFPCTNSGTLIFASDANHAMTAQESSAFNIKVTSSVSLTATRNLISPAGRFAFTIENATTGGQAIQIIGPSGAGVTIPNGSTYSVWFDGTNYVQATSASSYTLPIATPSTLGGVKPDNSTCTVNGSTGVLSCPGSGSGGIAPVLLATTGSNITLSGEQTIDGVLTSGSRVLVKDQTTQAQNGVYVSGSGVWTRSSDFASPVSGNLIYVTSGSINFNTSFALTTPNPITVGSTALTFTAKKGYDNAIVGYPCDILAAAGNTCVAAHSMVRRMFASYSGNLFQLTRASDSTTTNIGTLSSGIVNVPAITSFCAGTTCTVTEIYDQTGVSTNNLVNWNAGGDLTAVVPTIGFTTMPSGLVLPVLRIPPGVGGVSSSGYSTASGTSGLPTGNVPITVYMLAENYSEGGQISGCCGSYGDTENPVRNNGNGHMFSVTWGSGTSGRLSTSTNTGLGPWVGVDLENGVYFAGGTPYQNYLSVLEKYNTSGTALTLKDGDMTQGRLQTIYAGALPSGYTTMDMEGNIALGMGGDGTPAPINFLEGVIISSATSDATDNALQANFAAFFGPQQTAPPFVPQQNYTYSIGGYAPLATAVLPTKGVPGVLYTVINGLTATDCTAGGGTDVHQCYWNVLTASYLSLKSAGGSMVYPSAGVPISTGSAWGTSKPPAGSGAGYTTGPTSSTSGDAATYSGTGGQLQDAGFAPAPAVTCTDESSTFTPANNSCYFVTASVSTATPAASAFSAFTATTSSGGSLALTGTTIADGGNCSGYIASTTLTLPASETATIKSDGTTIRATCTAASGGSGNTTSTSLTSNTLPKANGANSIINSLVTDDGTTQGYSGTGGINASAGPVAGTKGYFGSPSTAAKAALPTGANGVSEDETTTAGVPASAVDYLRADATAHCWEASLNNSAESCLVTLTATQTLSNKTIASGNLTGTTNSGVLYLTPQGTATSGANYNSYSLNLQGSYWNGSSAASDLWSLTNTAGSGTNVPTQLQFNHSGSSGGGSILMSQPLYLGGHINQSSSGTIAGTCSISATGTSCTSTLGSAFTSTPVCIATAQTSSLSVANSLGCSVSGTTVTITSYVAFSAVASTTVGWLVIGNPN